MAKSVVRIRDELRKKMADVTERLMEVLVDEADPDNWTAAEKTLKDMDKDERGARFWDKRNATATLSLLHGAINLADKLDGFIVEKEVDDILEQVNSADRKAKDALKRMQERKGIVH